MGDLGEHFGLPLGTPWSAIRELFSGLVPGRVPGWILGAFWVLWESFWEGFWWYFGSILALMLGNARECWGLLGNACESVS